MEGAMRMGLARVAGAVGLILALAPTAGHGEAAAPAAERQYLMFQIFTAGPGFTTEPGRNVISKLPPPGFLDGQAKEILDAVGEKGDDRHRLGIIVGPLALDYTDAQMRELIERTFAIAAKYKIAVGLHIDESKFWTNRRDLWSNPANVEWLDWKGTPSKALYLNWGQVWKLPPQPCFNSPAMLKEARRLAGTMIGPAIAQQVSKLRESGEEALFAGVIVGWETAIGQDFDTRRELGYCALTNLGFINDAPPSDRDRALASVVQNWIGAWAKSLVDAGVSSDKIYSHIALTTHTPLGVAFGVDHRPGFTTYPNAQIFAAIAAALEAHGNPPWASSEGTNVDIDAAPPAIPQEGMEDYLARMFNHGAAMANVFGWGVGDPTMIFRRATESREAIAAYQKFLRGARLNEKPLADSYRRGPSALQMRMHALPGRIENFQRAGGDPRALLPQINQLEAAMRDGQFDTMTKQLDQIDATIDAKVGAN
jgi:hypothetical protein